MNGNYRRPAVKRRLVEIGLALGPINLGAEGREAEEITVTYTSAGDIEGTSSLHFGAMDGLSERRALGSNEPTDDEFEIEFYIATWGHPSMEDAEEAATRILSAFAAQLRALHRLAPKNGVPASVMAPDDYDTSCRVGAYTQPEPMQHSDGDMYFATIDGYIACKSNLK